MVVVVPIRRPADALEHALVGQQPGIGTGAGLAHPQRVGELVERAGVVAQEQISEDPPRDAAAALGLEQEAHAVGELGRGGVHAAPGSNVCGGRIRFNYVQYKLNVARRWEGGV